MIVTTRLVRHIAVHLNRDCLCQVEIDVVQNVDIGPVNVRVLAVTKFEADSADEVGLFIRGERIIEKFSMIKVFLKLRPARPLFNTLKTLCISMTLSD